MYTTLTRPGKTAWTIITSLSHAHTDIISPVLTTVIYTVVIKCTAGTLEWDGEKTNGEGRWNPPPPPHTHTQGTVASSFSTDWGPFSTESAAVAIFCLVTETKGQTFRGILYSTSGHTALIFSPILSPWNARFSILLVLGKYSSALGQQPSWHVPPTSCKSRTPVHCSCAKI